MASPPSASTEKLKAAQLAMFDRGLLTDVAIVAEGREIPVHKAVLAATSGYFKEQILGPAGGAARFEVQSKYKVFHAVMRFCYFGDLRDSGLTPEEALDALQVAEDYGIEAFTPEAVVELVLNQMTLHNCLNLVMHPEIVKHEALAIKIAGFCGDNFLELVSYAGMRQQMLGVDRRYMVEMLKMVCGKATSVQEAEAIVKFCMEYSQVDSACDLLRDCKQWAWGAAQAVGGGGWSLMRSLVKDAAIEDTTGTEASVEWRVMNLRLDDETSPPVRCVIGRFFEWCIRIDHGAEGKLRIVYESALPAALSSAGANACIQRFPAAMFAWQVVYRGQNVFHERPVFICFPESVSLHWSTTLPILAKDLREDDELIITVSMTENPLLSLILYYFSSDLRNTVFSEDILNRLPHIEYRCLSAYSLFQQHVANAPGQGPMIASASP